MFEIKKTDDLSGFRFADFFAGIGGFHVALAAHGATCVFACENNEAAADVYERNHGIRPHGDITGIDASDVPAHDILTAGFPCQPFALGGKRRGLDDPRGKLIWDLLRIVGHHRPAVLILENVPGLLSHDRGKTFATIRNAIANLGYVVHTDIVNAADAWVPQHRERVFISCYRNDIAPTRLVQLPPSLFNYTVNEIVEDYLEHKISRIERPFNPSAPYVEDRVSDGGGKKLRRLGGYGNQGQAMRVYDANGRGATLGSQGGGAGALTGLYKLHGGNIRKLTKLEAQRMAGFPDSFIAHENEITAQRQFGNAVVPIAVNRVLTTVIGVIRDAGLRPVAIETHNRMSSESKEFGMARATKKRKEALNASAVIEDVPENGTPLDEDKLTPEQKRELAGCAERLAALGRRSTGQAFEYGEELAKVQAILPPKGFGKWLEDNCGIETRTAKNYTRVYKELANHRVRLEEAAVVPSIMFALLGAKEDAIEAVLHAFEKGKHPTVEMVKAMVSGRDTTSREKRDALGVGGRRGLAKLAELKRRADEALFMSIAGPILADVEEAVKAILHAKRVTKEKLAEKIEHNARHAHDVLEVLIAPLDVDVPQSFHNWRPGRFPETTAWGVAQRTFHRLGMKGDWPGKDAFAAWLVAEVYPVLCFAVRGEELPQELIPDEPVPSAVDDKAEAAVAAAFKPAVAFEPTESQRENIELQLDKAMVQLGATAKPGLKDELRAVIYDSYRKVAEINAGIAAVHPERR